MRVLHLIGNSLPNISGYSIRTHNILKFQNQSIDAIALTDLNSYYKTKYDIIDNVVYLRFPNDIVYKFLSKFKFLNRRFIKKFYYKINTNIFRKQLYFLRRVVKKYDIDLIHAHSVTDFGELGLKVAKAFKIPFIFEVRGFMEYTHIALGTYQKGSRKFINVRKKRTRLAKKADLVITLGKNMKRELIKYNISSKNIKIVPNGVDTRKLEPIPPNKELKKKLGLDGEVNIGYIGSIRPIEGIEFLIKSLKNLDDEGYKVKMLLVGNAMEGYFNKLIKLAKSLEVLDHIIYTGPISHENIKEYYSIIDIIVIPRLDLKVNRIVTPLKPLEAMAMEKLVITSNLPALCELVEPGLTGDVFYPNNVIALTKKLKLYIQNADKIPEIGKNAKKYVATNYDWKIITEKYLMIYENLI